ncbi:MAG: hypothetical protein JL50_12435 [Peptococcaceae bacterium BICA1-7]|nr:MAG: hypothetical protein JL50_12435 [Peptococcaceae bacterium BICA1-7]HBV97038.1 pyruvate, phosphate dikinase [Desulfotomaculum sp.]
MVNRERSFFLSWEDAFLAGPGVAGGKGWNLGRLDRYGFNVPVGGVLTSGAFGEFIETNRLQGELEALSRAITADQEIGPDTSLMLENLRERIKNGFIPSSVEEDLTRGLSELGLTECPVAVRSSASSEDSEKASFAGIHDSFLNVIGLVNILEAVKGCFASLWSTRAVAYRRKMNIEDKEVLPAVVIMEMVNARAAGIGFSCNPGSGREDHIVINANYGLGESVVGGQANPDQYILDRTSVLPKILEKSIGSKKVVTVPAPSGGTLILTEGELNPEKCSGQVLPDDDIVRLGMIILRVYDSLGEYERHQDVEWAFDNEKFFIVQARPVTSLPRYTYPEIRDQPEIWSNSNLRDAVPMVLSTILNRINCDIINAMISAPGRNINYPVLPGLQYTKSFRGRLYLNISALQWELYDMLNMTPGETNNHLGGHQPEITIKERKYGPREKWKIFTRKIYQFLLTLHTDRKAEVFFSEMREVYEFYNRKFLNSLTDDEIIGIINDVCIEFLKYAPLMSVFNLVAGISLSVLTKLIDKYFPGEGNALANALLAGRGAITSADQGYRLIEMAEAAENDQEARLFLESNFSLMNSILSDSSLFKKKFKSFLEEFGHRGIYESDVINPRWNEDPVYLLSNVKEMMGRISTADFRARQKETRENAWQLINNRCPALRRLAVKWWVRQTVIKSGKKEMARSEVVRFLTLFRAVCLEVGRKFTQRGIIDCREDVFHIALSDMTLILAGHWSGQGLKNLVSDRKDRRKELESLSPPDLIVDEVIHHTAPVLNKTSRNSLNGLGVAAGKASGKSRIIMHPSEGQKLGHGEILVAPSTDPGWTPLFLKAAGIVMETGGFLSHGAIVAREYGIPAVVNIPGVLRAVPDGSEITVDGDGGKVII